MRFQIVAAGLLALLIGGAPSVAEGDALDLFNDIKKKVQKTTGGDASSEGKGAASTKGGKAGPGGGGGDAFFSGDPIDPTDPEDQKTSFETGDYIYALLRAGSSWKDIYGKDAGIELMVQVHVDGQRVVGSYVTLKTPAVTGRDYLLLDIAPEPDEMTAYNDPDIHYATFGEDKYGPQKFTRILSELSPGKHTFKIEVFKYGKVYGSGSFEIEGDDYAFYADLNKEIRKEVAANRTLPAVGSTNLSLQAQMYGLVKNAGWRNVRQVYLKDKEWWVEEGVGRHMMAIVVAEDGDGWYFKEVTYKQDALLNRWGPLYITLTGDRVSIEEDKLTDAGLVEELGEAMTEEEEMQAAARTVARQAAGVAQEAADALNEGGSSEGEAYGHGESAGPGFFFGTLKLLSRLIAGLLLALSGALLLQGKIAEANPAAGAMVAKLSPFRSVIGVTLLGGGVLFLLVNLLYGAPLADILPDLACLVTGLYLGIDLILNKRMAGGAHEYLAAKREKIDQLSAYELPLGATNIVLGLIHLLAGGISFL